jgi:hypothetical protein
MSNLQSSDNSKASTKAKESYRENKITSRNNDEYTSML